MISIHHEVTGSHSGQVDCNLVAMIAGEWVGWLSYSEFQKEVSVGFIAVPEENRRCGIGTALVVALQERYPDSAIDFGMYTEDGKALLESLEWRVVENAEVALAEVRLAELRKTLAEYESLANSLVKASSDERAAILKKLADWNELSDSADAQAELISRSPRQFRYIVGARVKEDVPAPGP